MRDDRTSFPLLTFSMKRAKSLFSSVLPPELFPEELPLPLPTLALLFPENVLV
eukprot:CAMPEP_0201703248 /NCGR_PEP_ID=MMETSP0578-20130828/39109_1 /ASSEMBLY_ACC=CAM_ASM_000663 /TAXON_ID=267565 /ORGANISM="Skeletonema grethea, Strain CCMP 1804" /LENGTH=52 /DNA_ID=CAMNT_0048190987 /DNA_START=49 /DNA_END=204 /DNA_ORIENTATION=-